MATYNDAFQYNAPTLTYDGALYSKLLGETLCYHMNRLAATLINNLPQYDTQGAANIWAGTSGLALPGALNQVYSVRNSGKNYGYDTQGALNALAGTSGLGPNEAASRIAS